MSACECEEAGYECGIRVCVGGEWVCQKQMLNEADWARVFLLRCRSKQGHTLSDAEQALVRRAWHEDKQRYAAEANDVFQTTAPFGSLIK